MTPPRTVFVATSDLTGQVRGRSVPWSRHEQVLATGVGWLPADLAVTCTGHIADGHVWGSTGDLRLVPDSSTAVDVPPDGDRPGVRLYLGDHTELDGAPWPCGPRQVLREALSDLHQRTGLHVSAAFEHEFFLQGAPSGTAFSFERLRGAEPFGSDLVGLLEGAGFQPESWLPEYGDAQFEVTVAPAEGLVAADRAILLRELVRDLALRRQLRATFAPLLDPAATGNGVHVHISLQDDAGEPVLYDAARPGRLSAVGARFAAGIVRHAAALTAWTAPSPVSALRLRPHRWSAGGAFLAERDREALVRICPTVGIGGADPARQLHLEYRAADATANPWLVLAVLVRAGLEGLLAGVEEPVVHSAEGGGPDPAAVRPLPETLDAALRALDADAVVGSWFHPDLQGTQRLVLRDQAAQLEGLDVVEQCRRIAGVY
jgi:glutamine synthetase